MSWKGCTEYQAECVSNWTRLFAVRDVEFPEHIVENFLSFVDNMSCSAENYSCLGGSNGCADQLTNWDGTKKPGLASPEKKKGMSR